MSLLMTKWGFDIHISILLFHDLIYITEIPTNHYTFFKFLNLRLMSFQFEQRDVIWLPIENIIHRDKRMGMKTAIGYGLTNNIIYHITNYK